MGRYPSRIRRWADSRGSMPMAVLLTLAGVSVTAAAAPVVLRQDTETRQTVSQGRELDAAQAGLAAAQGRIRAATRTDRPTVLDRTRLLCGSPLTATLDPGVAGAVAARYHVEIEYFGTDPLTSGAARIACAAGGGPVTAPSYARIRSWGALVGTGDIKTPAVSRYLGGTYAFDTVRGGFDATLPRQIALYSPPQTVLGTLASLASPILGAFMRQRLCLDIGTDARVPAAGTPVRARTCGPSDRLRQNFLYRSDMSIVHAGSYGADKPMCLDAGAVHAAGVTVTLQPCATGADGWRHRWYYNATNNFEGVRPHAGARAEDQLDGFCLNRGGSAFTLGGAGDYPLILGSRAARDCGKEIPVGLMTIDVLSDLVNAFEGYSLQVFSYLDDVGPGLADELPPADCAAELGRPCRISQLANVGLRSMCLEYREGEMYGPMATKECAEAPATAERDVEQTWRVPMPAAGQTSVTGPIYQVGADGKTYCLSSSEGSFSQVFGLVIALATINPYWPDFAGRVACSPKTVTGSGPQVWRIRAETGDPANRYRIESLSTGRCLSVGEESDIGQPSLASLLNSLVKTITSLLGNEMVVPLDPFVYEWTGTHNSLKVVMKPCTSSDRQKWAGPAGGPTPTYTASTDTPEPTGPRPLRDIGGEDPAGAAG
ncbi:hypothetical protein GCM10010124_33450 [Pilimelia terevasa]|uniref:Ricin B lectin domain-containing protein n=1 Tax=Pilimelia terevasa TaxID=53372 RepID=A0A8J3FL51_9ACTN|nr:RICIN domain-containing protein [Pilimelia terevasa]GGK37930.1 hypothetical protein GCM10010124_33450 [Pilimelia terevasa]